MRAPLCWEMHPIERYLRIAGCTGFSATCLVLIGAAVLLCMCGIEAVQNGTCNPKSFLCSAPAAGENIRTMILLVAGGIAVVGGFMWAGIRATLYGGPGLKSKG
ncbi:MAG: hypothetical protein MPK62_01755 [Alphaproteobacteria bacterium]|nr:hypothetical protein [Alphaproteobacteria bacterium]